MANYSNTTLLGGYNFGFNENNTQLTGGHFKDPILVSAITVNGICVFFFTVLTIVCWWMKGKRANGRKVFSVLYGLLVAMFLSYGRTIADEIIHEYGFDMMAAYLALPILKQVLANGTDTTLIYVVYSVIKNRFLDLRPQKGGYEPVQWLHLGIWVVILLFGIADAGLFSYAQVYIHNDIDNAKALSLSNWYKNIHLSYVTVYCTVVLEMFGCAIFIFKELQPRLTGISELLIWMVTPFLAIRSISNVTLTIIYVTLAHEEQKSTGIIMGILFGLTSVVIYLGLVIIGFDKGWDLTNFHGITDPDGVVNSMHQLVA